MSEYDDFRKSIADKVSEKMEWKELATFVPNKRTPVYNWFYYKEGFSKELAEKILGMFGLEKGATVMDTFCGVGTTVLACKQAGINAIGYDVQPVAVFASRVKTADHDVDRIKTNAKRLMRARFVKMEYKYPPVMRKAFSKYALQDIAFVRNQIIELDPEVREFFVLALINASMKCSNAYKDGSVIKYRKARPIPLRKMLQHVIKRMIKDLEQQPRSDSTVVVEFNDSRRLPLSDESVDAIITSPPYLNNIDYTKVYEIEEYFIHGHAIPGVRAFVGLDQEKRSDFLQEIEMPLQARLYFDDMNKVLAEMFRVLKKGGSAAIVVGNGYVSGVVESDIILAYLAEKTGFAVERIYVLNTRFALENRTVKKGILRESMIILKK